jgi:hypothetical protein
MTLSVYVPGVSGGGVTPGEVGAAPQPPTNTSSAHAPARCLALDLDGCSGMSGGPHHESIIR